ncbi:14-3-3 protein [Trichomonas vaginalis G3]|uniref:14-3-3 protein n=1 Tax=Trichomonas vaginalis (strain ATCC PRA-98 / G3) TaxID=412133 RepID=A2FB70_TRIV3|nr:protein domain specific binding [Trichomonas vaginalis G3]EAX97851.1 14-3-3 protein [Trichomonas vaginalis G3]KAI5541788.1 protein domain specific binding [Trichomonas vaginalis G3]|eukprot:XP_001310781.1 14-3-3 protein [Trichomonas vaginalis G3]
MSEVENLMALLKILQSCECEKDIFDLAVKIAPMQPVLTYESARLLTFALKEQINRKRQAYKTLKSIIEQKKSLKKDYKVGKLVESNVLILQQVVQLCTTAINTIDNYLIPQNSHDPKITALLNLTFGDLLRYKLECIKNESERKNILRDANFRYQKAETLASENLQIFDPLVVTIGLNYAIFLYHQQHDRQGAIKRAQKTLEDSKMIRPDKTDDYQDCMRLQQLLKDNINQWTHFED